MIDVLGKFFGWYVGIMDFSILDVRRVWIDLCLLGEIVAVITVIIARIINHWVHIGDALGVAVGSISFVVMDRIMNRLPDYVSRLKKILSNAAFILGFDENRKTFFSSLGIRNTDANAKKIADMIYVMNQKEWETAIKNSGDMDWYLKKIHYSLDKTVRFHGIHLGKPTYTQGFFAVLVVFILLIIGISIFKKHHMASIIVIVASIFSFFASFGAILFYFSFLICYLSLYGIEIHLKRKKCQI